MLSISVLSVAVMLALAAAPTASAQPNNTLTAAERNICQDLDMCVDIMLRHAPDGFDYAVLAQAFQNQGDPALRKLLQLMGSDRKKAVTHAQYILADKNWQVPPAAQTQIAKLWPRGDLKAHSDIMSHVGTPLMRNRAISTLLHDNADVRAQSRAVLNNLGKVNRLTSAPVPPAAFRELVKAANTAPTQDIIALIGSFPQGQSAPELRRLLLTEDPEITKAAYTQLYKQNPNEALAAFKAVLPNLKSMGQALALSQLLQSRHTERSRKTQDGFYMGLARNVLTDKTLPPLAHMMALDAILSGSPFIGKALPNTPEVQAIFKNLIAQPEAPLDRYTRKFAEKSGANTAQFLPLIWAQVLKREGKPREQALYTDIANRLSQDPQWREAALPVLRQSLRLNKDWRAQQTAALGLGKARDKASQASLARLSQSHPILDVRAAARAALLGLQNKKINFGAERKVLAKAARYCEVAAFDFVEDAKQLPFFEDGKLLDIRGVYKHPALRRHLKAAYPTKSGWLAGYDSGNAGGGLLHYDNVSGVSEIISAGKTMAIIPVKPTPLGTFASEFWVVDGLIQADASLFHLSLQNNSVQLKHHMELPAALTAINVLKDQSLHFGFSQGAHPPLRLLPNGRLVSGCGEQQSKPNSGAPQSLPN